MGESRTDLLQWINSLLHLSYTRVEQCGSGAVYCQIIDSIYRDVPMSKVKFNTKQEYEYVNNFKVLQAAFDKHHIENHIPVDRLIKCRFQDNLEFLQMIKKHWDQYFPGGDYEPISRRKGQSVDSPSVARTPVPAKTTVKAKKETVQVPPKRSSVSKPTEEYNTVISDLTQQTMELKLSVEQAEKEREFYFSKLREIEIFVQTAIDEGAPKDTVSALQSIQNIMYRTEDGFEIPDTAAAAAETY